MTSPLPPIRVRIFIDFWNFQLSLNTLEKAAGRTSFSLDWKGVATACCDQVNALVQPASGVAYEGLHVYSSYTDGKGPDMKHKNWVETWLDRQPGVVATCVRRSQKKSPPKCPGCHAEATHCVTCGHDMRGMEEKGVDTRIVTDMMSLAWNLHSPSGVSFEVKIACIRALDKDFLPQAAPAVAQTAGSGRIRPRSRCFLAQGRRFSAQRTDLSSRFRSV